MFFHSYHEKVFFDYLKAYQDEFGAEKVLILVPKTWIKSKLIKVEDYKPSYVYGWDVGAVGIRVIDKSREDGYGTAYFDLPVFN